MASVRFDGTAVSGCTLSVKTYTCPTFPALDWNAQVTILSGYAVNVGTPLAFTYNQSLTMSGSAALTTSGNLSVADINGSNLHITGGTLTASGGQFAAGNQVQSITANVAGASMALGTGSNFVLNGNVSSSGAVAIGSHAVINGSISGSDITTTSPAVINGDITGTSSFTLESGSSVTGDITAPTVTLKPSSSSVVGNITATNSVTVGSSDSVLGSVVTGTLTMQASGANIRGSVTASSVVLNWLDVVWGTVYCTVPASGTSCSCISNNSGVPTFLMSCAQGQLPQPPAPSVPDHLQITQPGSGLTCTPDTVTVTACANASCSTKFTGGGSVQLSPGGQTFSIDSSGVNSAATIQQVTPGLATVSGLWNGAQVGTTVCVNTGTTTTGCNYNAFASGLLVSNNSNTTFNAIARTTVPFSIAAVTTDQNATKPTCVPAFKSVTKQIALDCQYSDPGTGTLPLSAGLTSSMQSLACASSGNTGTAKNVAVTFDANGVSSTALSLNYPDAGKIALNASYTGSSASNDAGLSMKGSATVYVAPDSFAISKVWLPGSGSTPDFANPQATDDTGLKFMAAGGQFSATLTALTAKDANGNTATTPNYGNESSPQSAAFSAAVLAPSGGNSPALSADAPVFVNGVGTSSKLVWAEVGTMTLSAANSSYMGRTGLSVNAGTVPVGRFVPSYFATTINTTAGVPMACPPSMVAALGSCSTFVYAKQPFTVETRAMNALAVLTKNYTGKFAHAVTLTAYDSGGNANPPASTSSGFMNSGAPNGSFAITLTSGDSVVTPAYAFGGKPGPTAIIIRAAETSSDGVTSAGKLEAGVVVASGRLLIANNYGSEQLSLPVNLTAQYWNGSQYLLSSTDSVSAFALSGFSLNNCTSGRPPKNVSCITSVIIPPAATSVTLAYGQGKIRLAAPLTATSADLSNSQVPYLQGPAGREVFGVYRSPLLYIREFY